MWASYKLRQSKERKKLIQNESFTTFRQRRREKTNRQIPKANFSRRKKKEAKQGSDTK